MMIVIIMEVKISQVNKKIPQFSSGKKELEAVHVSFSLSGAEFTQNLLPDNVDELSPFCKV